MIMFAWNEFQFVPAIDIHSYVNDRAIFPWVILEVRVVKVIFYKASSAIGSTHSHQIGVMLLF
jgi:hypothetical protein